MVGVMGSRIVGTSRQENDGNGLLMTNRRDVFQPGARIKPPVGRDELRRRFDAASTARASEAARSKVVKPQSRITHSMFIAVRLSSSMISACIAEVPSSERERDIPQSSLLDDRARMTV